MVRQTQKSSKQPTKKPSPKTVPGTPVSPEIREQWIAEAAYFRAQQRGFAQGHALEDWVAAEKEIDNRMKTGKASR